MNSDTDCILASGNLTGGTSFLGTMKMENHVHSNMIGFTSKYSWLVYSEEMNGGFCLPCVLFAKHSSDFGQLVSRPLMVFTTAANRLREHDKKTYHRNALMDADTFLRVHSQKQATVEQQMSAHQQ